jgi:hypothetical protein
MDLTRRDGSPVPSRRSALSHTVRHFGRDTDCGFAALGATSVSIIDCTQINTAYVFQIFTWHTVCRRLLCLAQGNLP